MSEDERTPKPLTNGDRFRAMTNEELTGLNICPKDFDWNFVCNFRKMRQMLAGLAEQPGGK